MTCGFLEVEGHKEGLAGGVGLRGIYMLAGDLFSNQWLNTLGANLWILLCHLLIVLISRLREDVCRVLFWGLFSVVWI